MNAVTYVRAASLASVYPYLSPYAYMETRWGETLAELAFWQSTGLRRRARQLIQTLGRVRGAAAGAARAETTPNPLAASFELKPRRT
jgi:hypothetical protein